MRASDFLLFSVSLFCRLVDAAELLCHSNPEMVAANANRSFPDALRAFKWSDESKCILSAGGGTKYASCHWEANVTAPVSWRVEETLQGHIDAVCAVTWSSDGNYVLTGSADNTARIWRAPPPLGNSSEANYTFEEGVRGQTRKTFTGVQPVATLRGHTGSVRAVAFSPDGHKAITGSADGTVRAWQGPDENVLEVLGNLTNDTVESVELAEFLVVDGISSEQDNWTNSTRTVANATVESSLKPSPFYDGDSGGWVLSAYLPDTADLVWSVAWPQRSRVLVGAVDRTACITSSKRTDEIILVACTPEKEGPRWRARGDSVMRDSYDRTARIWFAHWSDKSQLTPQWRMEARLQDRHMHSHLITVAAWSPDGMKLLTGSRDGIVRVWHTGGSVEGIGKDPSQWNLLGTLKGHTDVIWSVAWSPDMAYVLSGGRDKVTHIWKPSATLPYQWEVAGTLQEIRCLFTIDHAVNSVFYAGINMTYNVTGDFLDWEKDKGFTVTVVPGAWLVISGYNNQLRSCSTGGFAITCTNGVTSADHRWEAFGSNMSIDAEHRAGGGTGWSSPCQSKSRFALTADRFAKKLYASDEYYAVFRIRLATQEARGIDHFRRRVETPGHHVSSANIGMRADGTKDGLIGELQREFLVSPAPEGKYSFRPEGETGYFPAVWVAAWSPDGRKVMAGSRDGSVRVWVLHSHSPMQWKLEATLRGHVGIVWSVAWSPDSRRALTAGHDGLVRIWRVDDAFFTEAASSYDEGSVANVSNMSNASNNGLTTTTTGNTNTTTVNTTVVASATSSTSSSSTTSFANHSNVSVDVTSTTSTSSLSSTTDVSENVSNETANASDSL